MTRVWDVEVHKVGKDRAYKKLTVNQRRACYHRALEDLKGWNDKGIYRDREGPTNMEE